MCIDQCLDDNQERLHTVNRNRHGEQCKLDVGEDETAHKKERVGKEGRIRAITSQQRSEGIFSMHIEAAEPNALPTPIKKKEANEQSQQATHLTRRRNLKPNSKPIATIKIRYRAMKRCLRGECRFLVKSFVEKMDRTKAQSTSAEPMMLFSSSLCSLSSAFQTPMERRFADCGVVVVAAAMNGSDWCGLLSVA